MNPIISSLQVLRSLDGRACAEQVGVTVGIVNSADRRPHLLLSEPGKRVGSLLTGVGAVPLGGEKVFLGMRGVGEEVVLAGNLARLDVGDLLADLDEGITEAVELSAGL